MVTTRMETTHGLTFSVARVIEVTAWQSVNAVCHCCLTHGSQCHWTQISWLQWWGLPVAHGKKDGFICPCYLHMTCSMCRSRTSQCAEPASVQHALARPDSQFLCCTRELLFCDLRFSHILMTVMCIQVVHVLHMHSLSPALQSSRSVFNLHIFSIHTGDSKKSS